MPGLVRLSSEGLVVGIAPELVGTGERTSGDGRQDRSRYDEDAVKELRLIFHTLHSKQYAHARRIDKAGQSCFKEVLRV